MAKEQAHQSIRLDKLEQVPAENAKYYKRTIIGAVIGTGLGAIITSIIALILK